jgi:hypothetical protein
MGELREIFFFSGEFTEFAGKFRKIDLRGTTRTAPGASQACPQLFGVEDRFVAVHQHPLDHLPRGKLGKLPAYRAASGADAAFHAIINLFPADLHS